MPLNVELEWIHRLPKTHSEIIAQHHLDDMGHMNVMWYTHLFDEAIFGALGIIGLDIKHMEANQAGGFALESHIRYLAEVKAGDSVVLRTRFLDRSKSRFHLLNFMFNSTQDRLASTFEVVGAHIDMTRRRMSPMPESITKPLDDIIQKHQQLSWLAPTCGVMKP